MQTATTATAIPTAEKTKIYKDYSKTWNATSYFKMEDDKRYLKVTTSKGSNGTVTTHATSMIVSSDRGFTTEKWAMFTDFSTVIERYPAVKILNEKKVTELHNKSLEAIATHLEAANDFYRKMDKEEKEALNSF